MENFIELARTLLQPIGANGIPAPSLEEDASAHHVCHVSKNKKDVCNLISILYNHNYNIKKKL